MSNTIPFPDLKNLLYNHDTSSFHDWLNSLDKSLDYYQKFPTDLVNISDKILY